MRTTVKTVSAATVRRYEQKQDEPWKTIPVGAQAFTIQHGTIGTVVAHLQQTGTGADIYRLRGHPYEDGSPRFFQCPRYTLRRIRLPKSERP